MKSIMLRPIIDYRNLRINNISSDGYDRLKFLLYWPMFGLLFMFVECFYQVDYYYPIYCRLDDVIPFCEWFLIPYLFWFVYLVGMHLYTLLYDVDTFRRMMKYIFINGVGYGIDGYCCEMPKKTPNNKVNYTKEYLKCTKPQTAFLSAALLCLEVNDKGKPISFGRWVRLYLVWWRRLDLNQ